MCGIHQAPEPTQPPAPVAVPAPALRLSRSDVPLLKAGDTATITLFFTNMGRVGMDNALVTITTSDSLILTENAPPSPWGTFPAGQTGRLDPTVQGSENRFCGTADHYRRGKIYLLQWGSPDPGRCLRPVNLLSRATDPNAAQMDGPVPNVILQRYTYGESGQQVAAGSEFSLQLDFLNTSEKKKLENVVMTLEPWRRPEPVRFLQYLLLRQFR